jgi:hypothetical protein
LTGIVAGPILGPRAAKEGGPIGTARVAAAGIPVEHVRSILMREDETCFHVLSAASLDAVREAAARARLSATRMA